MSPESSFETEVYLECLKSLRFCRQNEIEEHYNLDLELEYQFLVVQCFVSTVRLTDGTLKDYRIVESRALESAHLIVTLQQYVMIGALLST